MSHAELSPSSAHRWLACPGSIRLCRGIPETTSLFAREGTFAHTIAADCLLHGIDAAPQIGRTDSEFTLDAEMAEHIQSYLNAVRAILQVEGGELLVEQSVRVNDDIYGTADALVFCGSELYVVDLKFGAGTFVDVHGNEQCMTYGLGALITFADRCQDVERVHLGIVQPRCSIGEPWRSSTVTADYLRGEFLNRLMMGSLAVRKPDAPLVAGDHCKFCPAKAGCPELRARALEAARDVFPTEELVAVKPSRSVTDLLPMELVRLLPSLDMVEDWVKAVRDFAFTEAKAGRLPGYKVVPKQGNRAWRDEALAPAVLTQAGISPWAPQKLLSPAQAEKALTKALGAKRAEAIIEQLAHKPITGETLAVASDPRPAVDSAAHFPLTN